MVFERENNLSYAVSICDMEKWSDYDVTMLEKGINTQLLRMHIRKINGEAYCYYDITSKQQFSKLYTYTGMTMEDMKMILSDLAAMVSCVNTYMLDLDCVSLSPDDLYVDLAEHRLYFVYCPDLYSVDTTFEEKLRRLFDYIVEHFNHSSEKDELMKVYEIYQRIIQGSFDAEKIDELMYESTDRVNTELPGSDSIGYHKDGEDDAVEKFVVDAVPKELIEDESEEKSDSIQNVLSMLKIIAGGLIVLGIVKLLLPDLIRFGGGMMMAVGMVVAGAGIMLAVTRIPAYKGVVLKERKQYQDYEAKVPIETNNAEASVKDRLSGGYSDMVKDEEDDSPKDNYEGHTMLLSDYMRKSVENRFTGIKLHLENGEECIEMTEFPAVIGCAKDLCSVVIDNMLVSRMHCSVQRTGDAYEIEDLNSTNGTSVNGKFLKFHEHQRLNDGDELLLGTLLYKVEIG